MSLFQCQRKKSIPHQIIPQGAAFQAGAAITGGSVEDYVLQQEVAMEDAIVKPTTDENTLKLYKEAFERYKASSKKLFNNHTKTRLKRPLLCVGGDHNLKSQNLQIENRKYRLLFCL